jgi:hypothetical protein
VTSFEGLTQDLKDMLSALQQFLQQEHPMVHQRHLARHGHLVAADHPHSRDRLRQGATRAGRHHRRTGAGEAVDAVDMCGVKGLRGKGHLWQEGGEAVSQHWLASHNGIYRSHEENPFL